MARPCDTCSHPSLKVIEELLKSGKPFKEISRFFNISEQSLWRHSKSHMALEIPKKNEVKGILKCMDRGTESAWSTWDVFVENEAIGRIYLQQNLQPNSDFLILRERKRTIWTQKVI